MEIPTPRFGIERGGYAVEDVDALLNQFFSVLASDPQQLTAAGMRGVRFRAVAGRPGYSTAQVNSWITGVARQLDHRDGSSASGTDNSPQAPAPAPRPASQPISPPVNPAIPQPYVEADRGFDLPSELHSQLVTPVGQPLDPANDPGRNAVQELPATPPWASVTVLVVVVAMIAYFGYVYFS